MTSSLRMQTKLILVCLETHYILKDFAKSKDFEVTFIVLCLF